MPRNVVVLLKGGEGRELVKSKCRSLGVRLSTFEELVESELDQLGKMRNAGQWGEFDRIFDEAVPEDDC